MSESQFCCHLCGSNDIAKDLQDPPIQNVVFHVVKCAQCGLYTTHPHPDPEFQHKLYADDSCMEHTMSGAYCGCEDLQASDHTKVLRELKTATRGKRLLDVGCGIGNFLEKAIEWGWDAYGVEPSSFAAKKAIAKFGSHVQQCSLHEANFERSSFDAVTIWYVLEHVSKPLDVLNSVSAVLKPDGICCIAVPNIRYLLLRRKLASLLGRTQATTLHAHEHLYQYSSTTLRALVKKAGMTPFLEYPASPHHVQKGFQSTIKALAHFPVRIIFALTSINMGGIVLLARNTNITK